MALKTLVNMGGVVPQVGWGEMSKKPSGYTCFGIKDDGFIRTSFSFAIRGSADEKIAESAAELPGAVDESESSLNKKAQKGLISLPLGWGEMSKKPSGHTRFGIKGDGFIRTSFSFAIRVSADEKISESAAELPSAVDDSESNLNKKLQKDLISLPRPLTVFSASPNYGTKLLVSFKGGRGAYSEDAALKAYPCCETVPCHEFEDAFKAVELWLADRAVLPIENSLSGSIHRIYDLLLHHRLHIVGEVQLPVNFCLLALPSVRVEQLKRVLSHPQAIAQSDVFLSKLGVVRENVEDIATAAQLVASKQMMDAGVIATARAAEIYSLNILAERIQDDPDNVTRFLALARDPIIPSTEKAFKTSIVFTLQEGPGVLFKALAVFALREINLTMIKSRPQRKQRLQVVDDSNPGTAKYFDYLFYIDFEASMAEPRAQSALGHLQQFATFLRVLGCYPMDAAV